MSSAAFDRPDLRRHFAKVVRRVAPIHPIKAMPCERTDETMGTDSPHPSGPSASSVDSTGVTYMSAFLWILFGILYFTALFVLGLATLRKGHTALFWFGILFPFLWILGAVMAPTPAAAAEARADLR